MYMCVYVCMYVCMYNYVICIYIYIYGGTTSIALPPQCLLKKLPRLPRFDLFPKPSLWMYLC